MKIIAKGYEPQKIERELYKGWEEAGYFKPEINPEGEPYTIIMPPPNSNGSLHLGHAVFVTLEDIMIRFARLCGKAALWLPGADHAGFETQAVYEKKLEKEGRNRFDIDRDQLYKETLDFTLKNKSVMEGQLRELGASCDWSRQKFTLDPDIVEIVYDTFEKLYDDGLVYRDARPVNWCTKHQTSLSDLEVKYEERVDSLYYLKYQIVNPKSEIRNPKQILNSKSQTLIYITVATVRPETMFGDTAVAVNPTDKRYKDLIGSKVQIPLTDIEIEIIADEMVDPKFGTGVVKITPAHDPNDFEVAKRHDLGIKEVIDKYGKLNEKAGPYKGMKVMEARAKVVDDMEKRGLIEKVDENYSHQVGKCYKCGTIIEPRILPQWFVAVNKKGAKSGKSLAKDALDAVKKGEVKFITPKFEKIYKHWMNNIRDWNISRQIVWGIRLPVWYRKKDVILSVNEESQGDPSAALQDDNKDIYVGAQPPKDIENWVQDPDVFDTWFSSGQWPFATLQVESREWRVEGGKKIGFAGDVVEQVLGGKTKTYRVRDHEFKVGDEFLCEDSSNGRIFGLGTITSIEKKKIAEIDLQDEKHFKTYENVDQLIAAFKRRHPEKEITPETPAWIYTYSFNRQPSTVNRQPSADFQRFYPTAVMETGWDILFFWVARMIMLGLYITDKVPFRQVYLHGLVRDKDRQKMSKSKGNVIDPLGVAELYGTDAVRMALVFGVAAGNDVVISEEKIRGMRNFANKIWNASRFVILRLTEGDLKSGEIGNENIDNLEIDDQLLSESDREILRSHKEIIKSVTDKLGKYRFSQAGEELYEYIWHQFCDIYIEEAKSQLNNPVISTPFDELRVNSVEKSSGKISRQARDDTNGVSENTKKILLKILSESMIMLHPFMPFVSEAVWQEIRNIVPELSDSIMVADWPT